MILLASINKQCRVYEIFGIWQLIGLDMTNFGKDVIAEPLGLFYLPRKLRFVGSLGSSHVDLTRKIKNEVRG